MGKVLKPTQGFRVTVGFREHDTGLQGIHKATLAGYAKLCRQIGMDMGYGLHGANVTPRSDFGK